MARKTNRWAIPPPSRKQQLRSKTMLLPLPSAQVRSISLDHHIALELLRSGAAQERHLISLAQGTYIARFLCDAGYGSAEPELFSGIDEAILRARSTGVESGIWRLDDEEYALMSESLALHDQQLASMPSFALKAASDTLVRQCHKASLEQNRKQDCANDGEPELAANHAT
jgi:hypothetical protein